MDCRIEDNGSLKRRGRTLAAWSKVLDMLEDKECSWFEGLVNDSHKVKWMGRVYPGVTACRRRGGLCLGSLVKAFILQGRHRRFVGDFAFLVCSFGLRVDHCLAQRSSRVLFNAFVKGPARKNEHREGDKEGE